MLTHSKLPFERNDSLPYVIGFLCLIAYAGAFFFPLMDKDAAHHANIALYMYEHNDWISLVDRQQDYLDKPHFLFWSSLVSFKIFGINTFAHRLPAFLCALLSLYATYKLARHLGSATMAKLATLLLATAQAFIFSINDARMETPLTAGIMLGLWQLLVYVDKRHLGNLALGALGAAIAFATKGWLGPVVIFIAIFFYLLLQNKWKVLLSPKTWLFVPLFFLLISPVLYAYYVQFDLHPEKVIREKSGRSGIHFILWDQLFERSSGFDVGKKGRNADYFFLYHTFLWGFFPWSFLAYAGLVYWTKKLFGKKEWKAPAAFAALSFAFILFAISFSNFKMPHYIVMLLPLAALFTAPYLADVLQREKGARLIYFLQLGLVILVTAAIVVLNYYFFPPQHLIMWMVGTAMLLALVFLLVRPLGGPAYKAIIISAAAAVVLNFFMNYNFFPQLMQYQGGNQLVKAMKEDKIEIADSSIMQIERHSHSFDFYRNTNYPVQDGETFKAQYDSIKDKVFLVSPFLRDFIVKQGFRAETVAGVPDYNVTTIKPNFLNPKTRAAQLDSLLLVRFYPQ